MRGSAHLEDMLFKRQILILELILKVAAIETCATSQRRIRKRLSARTHLKLLRIGRDLLNEVHSERHLSAWP